MGEPRRIRVDLHCHTGASYDCLSEPRAVLEIAAARGLDRIAITDHDTVAAAIALREVDPERVIVGEEVKTREGFDVIGLFLTEPIAARTPAREACERIRSQGGVVYIPHPFDTARSGAGEKYLELLADLIDVVEVHNARCWGPASRANARALVWAERRGKAQGAGSDAHTLAEIGAGHVELAPFDHTRESFLAAMRGATTTGSVLSSPLYRIGSTYAKLRKRVGRR